MERSCAGSRSTPPGCGSHDRVCAGSAAAVRGSGDRRAPETRRSIARDAPASARSTPADRGETRLWIACPGGPCVEVAQMPAASGVLAAEGDESDRQKREKRGRRAGRGRKRRHGAPRLRQTSGELVLRIC